jgi:hypothetical protein
MNNKKSQTTTSKPKSRTMSGAVIASPRIIIRVSIETAHHDRGAGSLEAYRGHGLLAKVSFDTTNRLPFPTLSLSCSIDNRDVVFVLLSAFSWPFRVGETKPSAPSDSSSRREGPSPPATPPDFRQTLRGGGRQTFGAIYIQ